jgi:hypothetical protein
MRNAALAQSERSQLRRRDHPMLRKRHFRKGWIDFQTYALCFSPHPAIVARRVLQRYRAIVTNLRQPPATAGRIWTSWPSVTFVSSPSP